MALDQPFISDNGQKADQITWQLIEDNYQNGKLVTTAQDLSASVNINYWVWQDNGQGNLLNDWRYNQEHRQFSSYRIKISNLHSVIKPGNYTAKLKWTMTDSP